MKDSYEAYGATLGVQLANELTGIDFENCERQRAHVDRAYDHISQMALQFGADGIADADIQQFCQTFHESAIAGLRNPQISIGETTYDDAA